ncbi:hypothetical protein BC831DRAFT_466647 [Entophlyctis helioformis]|nr:hypothetical protein BC831DRAFT_466647 [Entophlyctis helioformis]
MTPQDIEQLAGAIAARNMAFRRQLAAAAPSAASSAAPNTSAMAAQLAAALAHLSATPPSQGTAMARSVVERADEQRLLKTIATHAEAVLQYESIDLQDLAREVIPLDALHEEAHQRQKLDPTSRFHDQLVRSLMKWFKNDFFKWVNQPPCDHCQGATVCVGATAPSPEDRRHGASVVELYTCQTCSQQTRFPRYNDPAKLLQTRRGRCGEWANVFCLLCKTMGFEARYIFDSTDHVWTEIYSDQEKRWVHADSCEGETALDTPHVYEKGWGKKLAYVIAIGVHDVVDVTRRYTANYADVLTRRTLADEDRLAKALADMTNLRRALLSEDMNLELARRDLDEQTELHGTAAAPSETLQGLPARQSGAAEWRKARGEDGNKAT